MFDKEQPYESVWAMVGSTIRGDQLSKRQRQFRTGALVLVFLTLVRLVQQLR
jgi:hypothetical protein